MTPAKPRTPTPTPTPTTGVIATNTPLPPQGPTPTRPPVATPAPNEDIADYSCWPSLPSAWADMYDLPLNTDEPGVRPYHVGVVIDGERVTVKAQRGDWWFVENLQGVNGWIWQPNFENLCPK